MVSHDFGLPNCANIIAVALLQLNNSYNNYMQLKNTITLNLESYTLKTRYHLFKNEPIFVIIDSINE